MENKKVPDFRGAIDKCIALKAMPHVFNQIKNVWGYPEFFEYVDNLLMVEEGREGRKGFPEGVYKEVHALKQVFMEYPDYVMAPELSEPARQQVKKIIKDIQTRGLFVS